MNPEIKIDFDPGSAEKYVGLGFNIVVVDVLRATSTIVVALAQNAKEVIACSEIDDALAQKKLDNNVLLVGERQAVKIDGFDYTNSPLDLSTQDLANKRVVITTSTGTRLISNSVNKNIVLIGTTLNSMSVSSKMSEIGGNWAVLGAGSHGEFRLEDQVGCALIVKNYLDINSSCRIDERSKKIMEIYSININEHIMMSPSTQKLVAIGRLSDVEFVIDNLDKYNIVPIATKKADGYVSITK